MRYFPDSDGKAFYSTYAVLDDETRVRLQVAADDFTRDFALKPVTLRKHERELSDRQEEKMRLWFFARGVSVARIRLGWGNVLELESPETVGVLKAGSR